MTVREVIERLQTYPPDAIVWILGDGGPAIQAEEIWTNYDPDTDMDVPVIG